MDKWNNDNSYLMAASWHQGGKLEETAQLAWTPNKDDKFVVSVVRCEQDCEPMLLWPIFVGFPSKLIFLLNYLLFIYYLPTYLFPHYLFTYVLNYLFTY